MSLAERVATFGTRIEKPTAVIWTLDIERAQGWARIPFWDLSDYKNRRIHAKYVEEWPRTICISARRYGRKQIEFHAEWDDREAMLRRAWQIYDEADIVVGHNIDSFDTKKLTAEWWLMGLKPPRPWKSVDTLKVARQRFSLESNTLDSVCRRAGLGGKVDHYDPDVARDALAGNKAAQKRLATYNRGDVEQTEALFDTMRGWISNHPHVGTFGGEKRCPQCGSADLKLQPTRYRAIVIDYALYGCQNCGGYVRGAWEARVSTVRGVK